jgi:hypothetical protein
MILALGYLYFTHEKTLRPTEWLTQGGRGSERAGIKLGMVAHFYNPCYSGGKDQENCSSRPAHQKVNNTPISTNEPWWCGPVIPAEGGCGLMPALGKI